MVDDTSGELTDGEMGFSEMRSFLYVGTGTVICYGPPLVLSLFRGPPLAR